MRSISYADIQAEDIAEGYALREDWKPILQEWLAECSPGPDTERYWRLLDIYSRCLHNGEHPVEAAATDRAIAAGTFPRYF